MALDPKGKTALITGAGSGIGLEFAKVLLEHGCNVLVADLKLRPEAEDVFEKYRNSKDARVSFHETDVTNWGHLRAAFDAAMKEFGQLDIVCPGAGTFEPEWSNFWYPDSSKGTDNDKTSSFKILDLNIQHPIRATQLAIDYFQRQGHGHGVVVHISSIAAQMALLPTPMYVASKHAISGFVRSLADLEPRLNIRVNAVAPGCVKTPLWTEEKLLWVDEKVDKWVTAAEVADALLKLVTVKDLVGGTVLEVTVGTTRMVEELNDPGPGTSGGNSLANVADAIGNAFDLVDRNFGK